MAKPARAQGAPRKTSGAGFFLGVFVGLILGLAIALGVALYLNQTPIPFAKAKPATPREGADPAKPAALAGLPQSGPAPGAKGPEKPKFDFYKILPGGEEPVTDRELKDAARADKPPPEGARSVYYVQAGSFQNPADADNQKAKIAILGFESSVESANLPDKGTWYRVRLGPYTKIDDLNHVRQVLAQNGIDASLVKFKEPQ